MRAFHFSRQRTLTDNKMASLSSLLVAVCLFTGCTDRVSETDDSSPQVVEKASSDASKAEPPPTGAEDAAAESPDKDVAQRQLPMPGDAGEASQKQEMDSQGQPATEPADSNDEPDEWQQPEKTFEDLAKEAFNPPPDSTPLTKTGHLWVDVKRSRVYADGYVCMKRGPLEMFACPAGTKEHESIVATVARSREVHAALLAVEGTPGTPVRFQPEFSPPTGDIIRVFVCWYDDKGNFQSVDARSWVEDLETEGEMESEWVFAGSEFYTDPETKEEYYLAASGDMICVSNFSSAMIDVAIPSSASNGDLRFVPFEKRIPEVGTPVRLVLIPIAAQEGGADAASKVQEPEKPSKSVLSLATPKS